MRIFESVVPVGSLMRVFLIVPAIVLCLPALADDFDPNEIYIDKDVCPGEWCRFGDWTASKDVPIYATPRSTGPAIAKIGKNQTVKALTGNAYVKPQRYTLSKAAAGREAIWVLTYLGEGYFRVWEKGKLRERELGFSPYGQDKFLPYEMEWWVKFELPNGTTGWAEVKGNFKDAGL